MPDFQSGLDFQMYHMDFRQFVTCGGFPDPQCQENWNLEIFSGGISSAEIIWIGTIYSRYRTGYIIILIMYIKNRSLLVKLGQSKSFILDLKALRVSNAPGVNMLLFPALFLIYFSLVSVNTVFLFSHTD